MREQLERPTQKSQKACFAPALLVLLSVAAVSVAAPLDRPDPVTQESLAACELQTLAQEPDQPDMPAGAVLYVTQPTNNDPLVNYQRSSLGDWNVPGEVDRDDPWVRLLLLGPKRPLVIDMAAYIDGKPFRAARETWIDSLMEGAQEGAEESETPQESEPSPGEEAEAAAEKSNAEVAVESSGEESSDDATNESGSEESKSTKEDGKEEAPEVPTVATQYRQVPPLVKRLSKYLSNTGTNADREEIRWLAAQWGSGPALVVLGPAVSWQRSEMAPLYRFLDVDEDGILSAEEIAQTDQVLDQADVDGNVVVEMRELVRGIPGGTPPPRAVNHSLLTVLDEDTDWNALVHDVVRIYGNLHPNGAPSSTATASLKDRARQGDATLDAETLRGLVAEPADVTLRVNLGAKNHDPGLAVLGLSEEFASGDETFFASPDVVTMDLGTDYLELSAAVAGNENEADPSHHQVAIGAVIDGFPLWRWVDQNHDQRLTLRERVQLRKYLESLEKNGDGQIDTSEMPVAIRLAVTLGPRVHELLEAPSVAARVQDSQERPPAPDWFVSMDKNRDGDVSRSEFLGTTEQFRQFDADGDGLLSVSEALVVEGTQ